MSLDIDIAAGQDALRAMRTDDAIAAFNRAVATDPENVPAHLGLYEAYQIKGDRTRALEHQARALERQRLFLEKPTPPGAPTVLLVAIPGDWQANVPLEFLYNSLNLGIIKMFVDDVDPLPPRGVLPPFDVIFNIIGHSEQSGTTLKLLENWFPKLGERVLNDPARVQRLSRDGVARDFADLEGALVPVTRRVSRSNIVVDGSYVIRPVGSQAGSNFSKIETPEELSAYLAATPGDEFYLMPFVDYRRKDGYFRKYRIIFVGGVPYAHHLAISQNWMVHYYNALNAQEQWIRDEEERFVADVGNVFDGPRARVLEEIARRVGLDYFGIDCSVLEDGRVLIFEIDPAVIVHLADSVELYPYKHKYVPRIPAALERLIRSSV
ncbi:MAG: tetratricopeptide repeat protein [Vulcanimicrobiaceae bacterium]|jgi:tetratricopeptide (TPR) repeat protein